MFVCLFLFVVVVTFDEGCCFSVLFVVVIVVAFGVPVISSVPNQNGVSQA